MSHFPFSLNSHHSQASSNSSLQSLNSSVHNLQHPLAHLPANSASHNSFLPFTAGNQSLYFTQQQSLNGQQSNLLDLQFSQLSNQALNQSINLQQNNGQLASPLFRSMDLLKYQLDHGQLIANGVANSNTSLNNGNNSVLKSACTNLPINANNATPTTNNFKPSSTDHLLKENSNKSLTSAFNNTTSGNSINFLTNNLLGQSAFNRTSYSNALRIENLMHSKNQNNQNSKTNLAISQPLINSTSNSGPNSTNISPQSNLTQKTLNELEALVHEQKRLKDLNNNLDLINLSYQDKQQSNSDSLSKLLSDNNLISNLNSTLNQFNENQSLNITDYNHLLQMLLHTDQSSHLHQISQQLTNSNLFDPLQTNNSQSIQNQLNRLFLRQSNNSYLNSSLLLSSSLSNPSTINNQLNSPLINKTSSSSISSSNCAQPVQITNNQLNINDNSSNESGSLNNCASNKSSRLNSPISDQTVCSTLMPKLSSLENHQQQKVAFDSKLNKPILTNKEILNDNELLSSTKLKKNNLDDHQEQVKHPSYQEHKKDNDSLDQYRQSSNDTQQSPLNSSNVSTNDSLNLNNSTSNQLNYLNLQTNSTNLLNNSISSSFNLSTNSLTSSMNSSSGESLNNLLTNSNQHLFNLNSFTLNGYKWDSLSEITARLLFMVIKWIKSLPTFHSLAKADQLNLLEENWKDLFLMNVFQYMTYSTLNRTENFNYLDKVISNFQSSGCNLKQQKSPTELQNEIKSIEKIHRKFIELSPDITEFSCLKAIVLFKSGIIIFTIF